MRPSDFLPLSSSKIAVLKVRNKILFLQLVAHPVDFLYIGEDHLGVDPALLHHPGHVLGCEEVRYSSKLLSCGEGEIEVSPSVSSGLSLQGFEVKRLGEEVVDLTEEEEFYQFTDPGVHRSNVEGDEQISVVTEPPVQDMEEI